MKNLQFGDNFGIGNSNVNVGVGQEFNPGDFAFPDFDATPHKGTYSLIPEEQKSDWDLEDWASPDFSK